MKVNIDGRTNLAIHMDITASLQALIDRHSGCTTEKKHARRNSLSSTYGTYLA